jgi:hypothetical protein
MYFCPAKAQVIVNEQKMSFILLPTIAKPFVMRSPIRDLEIFFEIVVQIFVYIKTSF